MGKVTDLNIAGVEKGKFASNQGTAHELLATSIIMRLGFDVSVSSVKGGSYDIIITAYKNGQNSETVTLKAQVKTAGKGKVSFVGGVRGGKDRAYSSAAGKVLESKRYKYTKEHNDLVIGVNPDTLDLYLIPTALVEKFGDSKSLRKLQTFKNNWDILKNWNEKYLIDLTSKALA